jgi:predicted RNase H-like HicB family nuclease/DNA-binding XRE family transcriptional regulator
MRYPAIVVKEGKNRLVEFPSCPGCQTFAEPGDDVERVAAEALEAWLESHLASRQAPPLPPARAPKGALWIAVRPMLALKVQLRHYRAERGWTQERMAKEMGWKSQAQVAKLEDPDENLQMETVIRAANVLGLEFDPLLRSAK